MKSSSQTFIFKYLFPVLMLGMALFAIYMMYFQGDVMSKSFAKAFAVAFLWISYFLIQMPIRLKSIEAKENGIIIKNNESQLIEYKNIVWITKFDITSPFFITIKYRDKISDSYKKIAYMPNQRDQKMFQDDNLTAYIKNKVKSSSSDFTREQAPSTMKNFLFLMLLSLPFTILMLYFLNETFRLF